MAVRPGDIAGSRRFPAASPSSFWLQAGGRVGAITGANRDYSASEAVLISDDKTYAPLPVTLNANGMKEANAEKTSFVSAYIAEQSKRRRINRGKIYVQGERG